MTERPTETRDANVKAVLATGAAVCVLLAVALSVLFWLFGSAPDTSGSSLQADRVRTPDKPVPGWIERPLDSYDWVDREAGTVAIPIDEAMKRVVERYDEGPRAERERARDAEWKTLQSPPGGRAPEPSAPFQPPGEEFDPPEGEPTKDQPADEEPP